MNRKKFARITALVLCFAVIATAANWSDIKGLFVKEIVATEEQGSEKAPAGSTVTKFNDRKTEINLSTPNGLSNINDYLPKTIKAVMDDGSEKEVKILNWKFLSADAPKDGRYKYIYKAQTEDAYALGKDVKAPQAFVYIKESELDKDTVIDNGVYSISAKKKAEVCPECFKELDSNGLCSGCHDKDCECTEIDIDLKNMNSILAFGKKYIADDFMGFERIWPQIFRLDTDWIRSLPKNQREVIDTLFRAYRYENEPEFYTYISALSIKEFLAFLDNNILGYTFDDYKQNGEQGLSLSQIKKLSEKIPDFAMKDIYANLSCMLAGTDIRDNINSEKEEKELKKIADQVSIRKKVSFSSEKNSLRFSSLKIKQNYIKKLAGSEATDAFGDATGRGYVFMNYMSDTQEDNGNGPYARYYLFGKAKKSGGTQVYSPAFCGNHGLHFAGSDNGANVKFKHIDTAQFILNGADGSDDNHPEARLSSCIGSVLGYIATNYKSLAGLKGGEEAKKKEVGLYTIVQSTIWNATNTGIDKWRSETSFKNTCYSVCNGISQDDACAIWWVLRHGGTIDSEKTITIKWAPDNPDDHPVYKAAKFGSDKKKTITTFDDLKPGTIESRKDYDIWRAVKNGDDKQPMLTPQHMELPQIPHIQSGKETIRTKMVVRHNINNTIDTTTGKGVIGKWNAPENTPILFNTELKTIKEEGMNSFYFASKSYDGTPINDSSDNPSEWTDPTYITQYDGMEYGGGKVEGGVPQAFKRSFRYISPLFYDENSQYFNYSYTENSPSDNDSDYVTCIKRHLFGKDALKTQPDNATLNDLSNNLPYKCNGAFPCQYVWQFSDARNYFALQSSHEEECIELMNWIYTEDKNGNAVDKNYEQEWNKTLLAYRIPEYRGIAPTSSVNDDETTEVKKFGVTKMDFSYVTFTNRYIGWDISEKKGGTVEDGPYYYQDATAAAEEVTGRETIPAPETLKHKLILNYQGGYLKDPTKIATINKADKTFITNNETNNDAEYSHTKNRNAKTTETVGAVFTGMKKEERSVGGDTINVNKTVDTTGNRIYKKKEANNKENTITCEPKGEGENSVRKINADEIGNLSKLEGNDEDSNRTFIYGKIDGLETVIDFTYEGDYVASLPTPSRYGYNFLGWYTKENKGGTEITPITVPGYTGEAIILDEGTMAEFGTGKSEEEEKNNDTLELFAAWELITKDQKFYIDWMDNDNRYTTRPDTAYVQLYRATKGNPYENVTDFITENIGANRFDANGSGDWVHQFSNETGSDNKGGENREADKNFTDSSAEVQNYKHKFGSTATNEAMIKPNEKIYKNKDGVMQYLTNPYQAFNGNGTYSGENYMKVSLYKDTDSTASSTHEMQEDIEGDNNSPSVSNRWTFTLRDLQKFDTKSYENGITDWKEYQYVIKQIYTLSKDYTLRYVTTSNNYENSMYGLGNDKADKMKTQATDKDDSPARYGSKIQNYYTMDARSTSNDHDDNSKTKYNLLSMNKFGNGVINRIANIYDEPEENLSNDSQKRAHTFKTVQGTITFRDGTDKFHFRPYSMVVDLYQNISANRHGDSPGMDLNTWGVREIIQSKPIVRQGNPYSAVTNGDLNVFEYKFDHVPTLQEETGIKYGYDVVLTHNQKRYRYTINTNDAADNFFRTVASNECFSYVHRDIIKTPVDINIAADESNGNSGIDFGKEKHETDTLSVLPIYQSLIYSNYTLTSQSSADTIYEGLLKKVTPSDISNLNNVTINQYSYDNPVYKANYDGQVASNYKNPAYPYKLYQDAYCSMAYNLRYYYINEKCELNIKKEDLHLTNYPDEEDEANKDIKVKPASEDVIDHYINISTSPEHRDNELQYKETLQWNFTVTLNGSDHTTLPTEYTGSESPDDRSGIFTGGDGGNYNSDFTHTQNKLIVKSRVFADDSSLNNAKNNYTKTKNYTAEADSNDYERLAAYKECEGFLLTFRQVKKTWKNDGDYVFEDYEEDESPVNGKRINRYTGKDALSDKHISFCELSETEDDAVADDIASEITAVGNTYNLIVPAEGETEMMYLPDGKYEITCHSDIDLHSFSFTDNNYANYKTAVEEVVDKNGKSRFFITFSSTSNQIYPSATPYPAETPDPSAVPVPFDVKDAERENTSNMTHKSEIDWWRGYVDDAANIAFKDGKEIDQSFKNHSVDLLDPTSSLHHPTVVVQSPDNFKYYPYNNTTKDNTSGVTAQKNGFQVNTWQGDYKNAENKTDKAQAPLQYNSYVLRDAANEGTDSKKRYGNTDTNAFSIVHNYDAFYIGSHSWAEIRENLKANKLPEEGQELYGIGGTVNELYDGTKPTEGSKPKVTGPNVNRIDNDNLGEINGRFRTGIIADWKSSMANSNKDNNGSSTSYEKPETN